MASTARIVLPVVAVLLTFAALRGGYAAEERLQVDMTLVQSASATGAFCLDGSLPAYHLHKGSGTGANNWLLQFEGGGWCNDVKSCLDRANTRRGSTKHMTKLKTFSGILSNNEALNPDFYNWNRVKLRYCDGASFAGDAVYENGTSKLYFRGQKIWEAIIEDLLPKGLGTAEKALLSGCSAGGLSAILHCDSFAQYLPKTTLVKCLSDGGFFMDVPDVSRKETVRSFYKSLVTLQGVEKNLNKECTKSLPNPELCIFPKWSLKFIKTPLFILNSAYDTFQFHHILVPPSSDPQGLWNKCRNDPAACNPDQIEVLQGFRRSMVDSVTTNSEKGGVYINSCFAHCQSESQDTWLADDSPLVNNKKISKAVGDWYFERSVSREIDCPYPCDRTCHNLIPAVTDTEEEKSKAADVV